MQQKMIKLINFLIIGLIISLLTSCEKEITYWHKVKGCINNQSSDSLYIQWYWNYCDDNRSDSLALASGEFREIDDPDKMIFSIRFDSIVMSNSKQKIVYIPHPRLDTLDHCVPLSFINKFDPNKSNENLYYYSSCTITDSTFQFMADECAKLGQDIWRKK